MVSKIEAMECLHKKERERDEIMLCQERDRDVYAVRAKRASDDRLGAYGKVMAA